MLTRLPYIVAVCAILLFAMPFQSEGTTERSELSFCNMELRSLTFDADTYVSNTFNSSLPSIVDTFQSWGGHDGAETLKEILLNISSDELNADNEDLKDYAQDLAVFAVPGIVMFVLTFIFGVCMICARWCCPGCCCKPNKSIEEYSWCDRYWPMMALNIVAFSAALVAILAIISIDKIRVGTQDALCEMDSLSRDIASSFDAFDTDLKVFLSNQDVVDFDSQMLNENFGPGLVNETSLLISNDIDTINANHAAASPVDITRSGTINHQTCAYDPDTSIFANSNYASTKSSMPFDDLAVVRTQWNNELERILDEVSDMIDATEDASEVSINIYNWTTIDFPDIVETVDDFSDDKMEHWQAGSFAFFFFVFFAVIVAVGCVVAYITPCKFDDKIAHGLLHCSWFFSWAFAAVLFLFCGLGIPIAIIFSDTCVVVHDVPTDVNTYFGDQLQCDANRNMDACRVISSCFSEPAPAYLDLNMATVDVDAIMNYDSQVIPDNSAMSAWTTDASDALDAIEECYVSTTDADDALAGLNTYTTTTYTRTECLVLGDEGVGSAYETEINGNGNCAPQSAHSGLDPTSLSHLRTDVIQTLRLEHHYATSSSAVSLMANVESMRTFMSDAESTLNTELDAQLSANTKITLVRTPYTTLQDDTAGMNCQFAAPYFDSIVDGMCSTALDGLATSLLLMFVVAILGWPQIVFSTYVSIRDFGSGHKRGPGAQVVPSGEYDGKSY